MTDEFGPWDPASVEQVTQVFTGAPFRWWLTGGVALELFIGHSWRAHDDVDIGICRIDATAAHNWLVGLDPYVAAGGSLRRWVGEPLSAERAENNVWVKRPAGPFLFDIAIGDGDGSGWMYRRDPGIRRPWDEALLRTPSGVPYLAPEIQLLFKNKGLRAKDKRDAERVIPAMGNDRRNWLRELLPPDHPWQNLLKAEPRTGEPSGSQSSE